MLRTTCNQGCRRRVVRRQPQVEAMRKCLSTLSVFGFVAALMLAAPASGIAADLAVTPAKKRVHHTRSRVVRDYDGTPIILRRIRPVVARSADGTVVALNQPLYEAIAIERATPRRYLNGQPVWPTNRLRYIR
jgi:hypothetical protein